MPYNSRTLVCESKLLYVQLTLSAFKIKLFYDSRGKKYPLMTKSRHRDGTEPTVFVPEVAKQHDVFVRAIASGVVVSAGAI